MLGTLNFGSRDHDSTLVRLERNGREDSNAVCFVTIGEELAEIWSAEVAVECECVICQDPNEAQRRMVPMELWKCRGSGVPQVCDLWLDSI